MHYNYLNSNGLNNIILSLTCGMLWPEMTTIIIHILTNGGQHYGQMVAVTQSFTLQMMIRRMMIVCNVKL